MSELDAKDPEFLTPKQRDILSAHLDRIGMFGCPVCTVAAWSNTSIVAPWVMDSSTAAFTGTVMPIVGLVCGNCSHIAWFSWRAIEERWRDQQR